MNYFREGFGLGHREFGILDCPPGGRGDSREVNCGIGCLFRTSPGEKRILKTWVTLGGPNLVEALFSILSGSLCRDFPRKSPQGSRREVQRPGSEFRGFSLFVKHVPGDLTLRRDRLTQRVMPRDLRSRDPNLGPFSFGMSKGPSGAPGGGPEVDLGTDAFSRIILSKCSI